MHPLAQEAAALLDTEVSQVKPLHGGDLSDVLRLTLADGRRVVAKSGPAPKVEAAMLRAIAAADVPAPDVLAASASALILQDLPEGGGLSDAAWGDLGAHLARLHATTGPRYGWPSDYAFGALPIRNTQSDNWPDFWAQNRLLPELPRLPAALHAPLERIAHALPGHLPATPRPSLLHGDLWTGNVMAHQGRISALIDPASYYGDAGVDLAMLELFATPAPAFWRAYGAPGDHWPICRAIYQIWPAIVHIRLFGAGYVPVAERLIAQIPT